MPVQRTIDLANRDKLAGKSPSTQAGEFVREEIHRVRKGAHGVRSPEQAIAIGLSMARRAGVRLPPPSAKKTSLKTRHKAQLDWKKGRRPGKPSLRRSRARIKALQHEPTSTVSHEALSKHAHRVALRRGHADLSFAAHKAAHTRKASVHRSSP